jgi:hypothetical protein
MQDVALGAVPGQGVLTTGYYQLRDNSVIDSALALVVAGR